VHKNSVFFFPPESGFCNKLLNVKSDFLTHIKKIQQVYQNFISDLYEAEHVSGDTPPIIGSLKLDAVQQLHGQQPSTYAKPEAASAVLGSR
jgi:hypothetical protein